MSARAVSVRHAEPTDVLTILDMGLRFHAESQYARVITPDLTAVSATIERMITTPETNTILMAERDGTVVGMLALGVYAHPMTGLTTAAELVWWVDPQARQSSAAFRLMDAAEQWARKRGAVCLQMVAPDETVERMYARHGYARVEVSYQKRIG